MTLNTFAFLADYHGKSGWRGTAGFMINNNSADLDAAVGAGGVALGTANTVFAPPAGQVGSLKADVDYNTFAPYLGVGYGNPFTDKDDDWSFSLDLGVLFQGNPDVDLASSANLTTAVVGAPTLAVATAQERAQLESSLDNTDIYPVISVGGTYRF